MLILGLVSGDISSGQGTQNPAHMSLVPWLISGF